MSLTIITPTYNEVENIDELVTTISKLYPQSELIVADDGSKDGTQERVTLLKEQGYKVRLLDRSEKEVHGLTASVMDAILICTSEYFIVIDADLQHPPEVIDQLYQHLKDGADMVSGAREPYKENQGVHRIAITRVATKLAKLYLKLFAKIDISDPMSGFFGSRTELAKNLIESNPRRFEPCGYKVFFDLLKCSGGKIKFEEVIYQFRFRTGGKSKLAPRHALFFLRGLLK